MFGKVLDFGDTTQSVSQIIPNEDETEKITSYQRVAIKSITINLITIQLKYNSHQQAARGIKLVYTGNMANRWIGQGGSNHAQSYKTIELDQKRPIQSISVLVRSYHTRTIIQGLMFFDEEGDQIGGFEADKQPAGYDSKARWVTQSIPKGQSVLGLLCHNADDEINDGTYLSRLGFVLWKN